MVVSYDTQLASESEQAFNTAMSTGRTAVEGSYKNSKQNSTITDVNRLLMARKSPVTMMCKASSAVCILKLFLHHGVQLSFYFACPPPSIKYFLRPVYEELARCFKISVKMQCIRSFAVV